MKPQNPVTPGLASWKLPWLGALVLLVVVAAGTVSVLRPTQERPQLQRAWRLSGTAPFSVARAVNAANIAPTPKKAAGPRALSLPAAIVIGSTQQTLINIDRARYGLRPLTWSSCLGSIGSSNAYRMARQGYISHTDGATRDLGCHLGYQAGENVGYWSQGVNDAQINTLFMNSADHRANILGPYHYVATSWVTAPNGHAYVAVEFS
jgi:uncharacterized protein YkwD